MNSRYIIKIMLYESSHVAYLLNQRVQLLITIEWLGHKYIKITLNTYEHLYSNQ